MDVRAITEQVLRELFDQHKQTEYVAQGVKLLYERLTAAARQQPGSAGGEAQGAQQPADPAEDPDT